MTPLDIDGSAEELAGGELLQRHFARMDAAAARCDAFEVRPGSILAP